MLKSQHLKSNFREMRFINELIISALSFARRCYRIIRQEEILRCVQPKQMSPKNIINLFRFEIFVSNNQTVLNGSTIFPSALQCLIHNICNVIYSSWAIIYCYTLKKSKQIHHFPFDLVLASAQRSCIFIVCMN